METGQVCYDRAAMTKHFARTIALLALAGSLSGQAPNDPGRRAQDAVLRALPRLQSSAAEFVNKRACLSCHHNVLPIVTLVTARQNGLGIDQSTLSRVEEKTFRELRSATALDDAIQGINFKDPTPNDSYLLMAAQFAGIPRSLPSEIYARRLLSWQHDGHWLTSDFRPPHSSSLFTATATAIFAIRAWSPPELNSEQERALQRTRRWLASTRPLSTEDAAFRLMGLVWTDADYRELGEARATLLNMQARNGGWPQLSGYEADAYSTGEALYALSESGMAGNSPSWQKGAEFLLSSQAPDGTWRVHTRMLSPAEVSPPYFSTGFPYGKDEFISYAGTSWAVLALLRRSHVTPIKFNVVPPAANPDGAAGWIRTALFGTTGELQVLLEHGLDPNSRTANGSTLLMMAAASADKVRLLLTRGAKADSPATSGADVMTVAAGYRHSRDAMELLLKAGAEITESSLETASRVGDVTVVKFLLAHGADPAASALAEAVTFGHADVVDTLIRAGADASITEPSGVNLLHWATITNRTAVIPLLAKAKVPINDKDMAGFTPLMYAATLDFGETETLRALLKAGANREVKNDAGLTALEQAKSLKHALQASVLASNSR